MEELNKGSLFVKQLSRHGWRLDDEEPTFGGVGNADLSKSMNKMVQNEAPESDNQASPSRSSEDRSNFRRSIDRARHGSGGKSWPATKLSATSLEDSGHYGSDEIDGQSSRSSSVSSSERPKSAKDNNISRPNREADRVDRKFDEFVARDQVAQKQPEPEKLVPVPAAPRSEISPEPRGLMISPPPIEWKYKQQPEEKQTKELTISLKQRPNNGKGFGFTIKAGTRGRTEPFTVAVVIAGSKSDRCGLLVGDEIISIDGEAVSGKVLPQLNQKVENAVGTGKLDIRLRRIIVTPPVPSIYLPGGYKYKPKSSPSDEEMDQSPSSHPDTANDRRKAPPVPVTRRARSGDRTTAGHLLPTSPAPPAFSKSQQSGPTRPYSMGFNKQGLSANAMQSPQPGKIEHFVPDAERPSSSSPTDSTASDYSVSALYNKRTPGKLVDFVPECERRKHQVRGAAQPFSRKSPETDMNMNLKRQNQFIPGRFGNEAGLKVDRVVSPPAVRNFSLNEQSYGPLSIKTNNLPSYSQNSPISTQTGKASDSTLRSAQLSPQSRSINSYSSSPSPSQDFPSPASNITTRVIRSQGHVEPSKPYHPPRRQVPNDPFRRHPQKSPHSLPSVDTPVIVAAPSDYSRRSRDQKLETGYPRGESQDTWRDYANPPIVSNASPRMLDQSVPISANRYGDLFTTTTSYRDQTSIYGAKPKAGSPQQIQPADRSRPHSPRRGEEICWSKMPLPGERSGRQATASPHRRSHSPAALSWASQATSIRHPYSNSSDLRQYPQQPERSGNPAPARSRAVSDHGTSDPSRGYRNLQIPVRPFQHGPSPHAPPNQSGKPKPSRDPALDYLQFEHQSKATLTLKCSGDAPRKTATTTAPRSGLKASGPSDAQPRSHLMSQTSPVLKTNQHWLVKEAVGYDSITDQLRAEEMSNNPADNPALNGGSSVSPSYDPSHVNSSSTIPRGSPSNQQDAIRGRRPATSGQNKEGHTPASNTHSKSDSSDALMGSDNTSVPISGKQRCSHCGEVLGRGAAMIIETLDLFYHLTCFRCSVCGTMLGTGVEGADVRVKNYRLHCQNCYSNEETGIQFSQV